MPMAQQIAGPSVRDDRYPLPIFVFLVGLLGSTVAASLAGDPMLMAGVVVALTVCHLSLHWFSVRLADRGRPWLQYVLAQGGLGIALTFATGSPSVWSATFTWLIGEAVGMLDK